MAYHWDFGDSETWQPSVRLRWVNRKITEPDIYSRGNYEVTLQQLWTSNKGNTEWRDVPTVVE